VQEIEIHYVVHLGVYGRNGYRVAGHHVGSLHVLVDGTAERQDDEIPAVDQTDDAPAVRVDPDQRRGPVLRVAVLELVVLEVVQRQRAQAVRVTVVLDQTELGLGEAEQQRVRRVRAQRDRLQAHDVTEQRVLGQTLELGLGRLTRRVGRHQPVHPQHVDAGHDQTFFRAVEEVTVHGVFRRSRHARLFAQREHRFYLGTNTTAATATTTTTAAGRRCFRPALASTRTATNV